MNLEPVFFDWLKALHQNNNRDWYHQNKKDFEKYVKVPFRQFIATIIQQLREEGMMTVDIDPKRTIFRINRDTRFSKDKTPYKNNVGALLSDGGTKAKTVPGFYLHVELGRIMIGGGAYFLEKEQLLNIRTQIANQETALEKLLTDKTFKKYFGEVQGDKNKRLPKEFMSLTDKHPLLLNKQFYYMAEYPVDKIMEPNASGFVMDHFRAGHSINECLKAAMQ